jgi:hypothetical protein
MPKAHHPAMALMKPHPCSCRRKSEEESDSKEDRQSPKGHSQPSGQISDQIASITCFAFHGEPSQEHRWH